MDDDDDNDNDAILLNINLSSSSSSSSSADENDTVTTKRADRILQTEAAFQAIKSHYSVKVQNGQVHLPIHQASPPPRTPKQSLQDVIHAVEELYFFGRYRDALRFIDTIRSGGSHQALDHDTRQLLAVYHHKCQQKSNASS
ncbi:hypothetical protein L249_1498 [Ophiocordyceps polyrhachis-furcata BCC 54312]|uniref:Uncharacterized protein n=1 Tax=Ophiocordyceps polyrhachis-furcata BCC 54312 TaxID=1330021 RepID=A0A367L4B9_9HYPO|nr:hypothetical protein L249_1498 [Ophiocordyceps polyrhachis-furcata BCC 54312]